MATLEEKIRFWLEQEEEITPTVVAVPEPCSRLNELLRAKHWSDEQVAHAQQCRWCQNLSSTAATKAASEPSVRPEGAAFKTVQQGEMRDAAHERALLMIETHLGASEGSFDDQGNLHLKEGFVWPSEPGKYRLRVHVEGYPCKPLMSIIDLDGTPKPIPFARNAAEAAQLSGALLPEGSLKFEKR